MHSCLIIRVPINTQMCIPYALEVELKRMHWLFVLFSFSSNNSLQKLISRLCAYYTRMYNNWVCTVCSTWYNRNGRLGVKHLLTHCVYLCTFCLWRCEYACFCVGDSIDAPRAYRESERASERDIDIKNNNKKQPQSKKSSFSRLINLQSTHKKYSSKLSAYNIINAVHNQQCTRLRRKEKICMHWTV